MRKRVECIVHGDVQGVSYRAFVEKAARRLGLVGFVRNLPDDTVEVVAEGSEGVLRGFVQTLKDTHPFARVEWIDDVWGNATSQFPDFRIIR